MPDLNSDAVTNRVVVSELEKILKVGYKVLDHGFVRVIDYMGSDDSIVQAARVSYGHGTKHVSQDTALIRYLLRNNHTTPFEMCEIKFHICLPIFVARQLIRHRTANVNEYSARYSIIDDCYYLPELENISEQSQKNAQGRGNVMNSEQANYVKNTIESLSANAYAEYKKLLDMGLARELARLILPVNYYTQMYWKIDLHNLLRFLMLRQDEHAQYEIREYANVMFDITQKWVPITSQAFMDYKTRGRSLSVNSINLIKKILTGSKLSAKDSGLSTRELEDFKKTFFDDPSEYEKYLQD